MTIEEWRKISGWERYEVSNTGKIRSLCDNHGNPRKKPLVRKLEIIKKRGYLRVNLQQDGVTKRKLVHELVLTTFIGEKPKGQEGCHNDGNPSNNTVDNLRWDTPKANKKDSINHGTWAHGIISGRAKLTENQVVEIRELWKSGKYTKVKLGEMFHVSNKSIESIVKRVTWKHI